ncbi:MULTISPECIES: MMPL family transporter [Arsenicicoccus]|uniref:MMPL family transporter n=1 Tax=Arsenicicoccus TaxID=267408 RepID=UPI00257BF896|nr:MULTISPECIES: MMPL family transporter [Arsenicicoccus]
MATLLYRLGLLSARKPWAVIIAWLLLLGGVSGAAAAFRTPLSSTMTVEGLEFQQTLDTLKREIPDAAGGIGTVVFRTESGRFTPAQQAAVAKAVTDWEALPQVADAIDPFATQKQLDEAQRKTADGQKQLEASESRLRAGEAELAKGQGQVDGAARLGLLKGQQLTDARAKLAASTKQLADGRAQLERGKRELALGQRQVALTKDTRFVSADGTAAMTQVRFKDEIHSVSPDQRQQVTALEGQLAKTGVKTYFGKELVEDVSSVIGPGEIIGIVIAAIVLMVMLGTLVAAGLPLLMAIGGVALGTGATLALSKVVELNSVTPALGLMIGIAVGIDYALFIVNRHREQLKTGMGRTESIALAVGTAGNAVTFAGMTVFIALAALAVTGIGFLGTMGFAAAGTVACAVLINLTLLPALMSLAGHRMLPRRTWRKHGFNARGASLTDEHPRDAEHADRGWGAIVTRHPWPAIVAGLALVAFLAAPAAGLRLGLPDGGSEPQSSTGYQAYATIGEKFGEGANGPIVAVATLPAGLDELAAKDRQLDVAEALKLNSGLVSVMPAGLSKDGRTAVYQAIPKKGPADQATVDAVHQIREDAPFIKEVTGADVKVTGQTVANIDISQKLADALPPYLLIVVGLSLVLLLMVFRSVVVPLIATGGFLLSLAAAFGGVVAVYQEGTLGSIFGVTNPGAILSFLPILLIGVLFGLAMDYQMFLVSGMRESHVHGEDARRAVRTGFSHAAAVVTAAAIIMVSVFAGFVHAELTMIRPIGFGLALGVLIDAFLIRMTLTPAVMHLLGERAWWMPRWLDRIVPDVDVEGVKLVDKVQGHPHA